MCYVAYAKTYIGKGVGLVEDSVWCGSVEQVVYQTKKNSNGVVLFDLDDDGKKIPEYEQEKDEKTG